MTGGACVGDADVQVLESEAQFTCFTSTKGAVNLLYQYKSANADADVQVLREAARVVGVPHALRML